MLTKEKSNLIVILFLLQTAFVRGHRRTGSDVQFIERTRQDAQQSMNKELQKLILTAPTLAQDVNICI